jgi:NADH:ubiquinone oxidoreductase subunit C
MIDNDARLVTVSSSENPEGEILLDYHWDLNGELVTIEIATKNKQIDTIADITPAADWVEREIHDYFKVEFPGRIDTKRLMTREGDPQGIFCKGGAQ